MILAEASEILLGAGCYAAGVITMIAFYLIAEYMDRRGKR